MATIFDSIMIGNVEIKNRLAVAATVKNLADQHGFTNERMLANYSIEADGPGLYMVSMTYTQADGRVFTGQTGIHNALAVYGMAEVANRIHKAGGKAFLQISHGGNLCSEPISGAMPMGPSDIPQWPGQTVHALTTEEAEAIADGYGLAAERAKQAGYDGVEFHACHGSMMLQFISPIHNQGRTDKYADPPQFLYDCYAAARKYCGDDFVLGVRFTCHEFMEEDKGLPGAVFDDVKKYAIEMEKRGADYIHASAGRIGHTPDHAFPPLYTPRGVNVCFAEELKKVLSIPVVTVGRLQDARLMKKIVEDDRADIIAMCRPVIADPHIAKKVVEGNEDRIRQCMGCNWCLERLFNQVGVECPMNPAYGWEEEYALLPTATPKDVMIIGGGVSGLYAAYAAAKRGHRVTLYEKSDKLGGQLCLASQFPALYTRELFNLPRWLIKEIELLAVDVRLNTEVTDELIEQKHPDTIIFATGAHEAKSDIQTEDGSNVIGLWDYLSGADVGEKVVVFGSEAVEAAVSLALDGKKVTLLQSGEDFEWPPYIFPGGARREPLTITLRKKNVALHFGAKVNSIGKETLTAQIGDKTEELPYDTIISAVGRRRNNELYLKYKAAGREVYVIGDAKEVRNMTPASHEGYWVGRNL